MEVIDGQFYMKGCEWDDPARIRNIEELICRIQECGFLPLFSNSIEGFSVEEYTPPSTWWTGDPASDPWEWRQILARDERVIYGKFFGKKAGFVAKEWFPVFANYRRNGYDFDALFEDEMASYRQKKIMDVFALDDQAVGRELMSYEIKELAGFGKGGEKNFDGVLADLQMQTYLIVSDFRQKRYRPLGADRLRLRRAYQCRTGQEAAGGTIPLQYYSGDRHGSHRRSVAGPSSAAAPGSIGPSPTVRRCIKKRKNRSHSP